MRASSAVRAMLAPALAALLWGLASITPAVSVASDGTWRSLPLVPRQGRTLALSYDSARHRLLMFGGSDGSAPHNDVWAYDLSSPGTGWSLLQTAGTPPAARQNAAAFYDPGADRLVVFGGESPSILNDVWQLALGGKPTWSEIHPSGSPPLGRGMRSVALDPVNDRLLVFGGYYGVTTNESWVLALRGAPAWTKLGSMIPSPLPRYNAIAAFDAARGRFVVAGGTNGYGSWLGDAWALELDPLPVQTPRNPAHRGPSRLGPPKEENPAPPGGRWVQIASGGPNDLHPSAIADPGRDRLVALAGSSTTQAWTLDFATGAWSPLSEAATDFRSDLAPLAFDPVGDRALMVADRPVNEVWQLAFAPATGWTRLTASDATPEYRFGAAVVLDAPRDRVVLFGGRGNWGNRIHRESPVYADVLELPLDGRWREMATGGGPSARWGTAAIFDPVRERMIVFGGRAGWDLGPAVSEVWLLSLAGQPAWQLLSPAGSPPAPRWGSAAAYDPGRDRMIVFGGTDGVTTFGDTWSLTLGGPLEWRPMAASGTPPPPLFYSTLTHDPTSDRMILLGAVAEYAPTTELWSLDLAGVPAWEPLAPGGTPPPTPRAGHGAVYDAARDRLIVYGGRLVPESLYELSLRPTPAWRTLEPTGATPKSRAYAGVVLDARRNRLIAIGGQEYCNLTSDCAYPWLALSDAWQLQFDPPVTVAVPPLPAATPRADLSLATPRPNPAAVPTVSFALGDGSPARLEVFDLGGRRLLAREVGAMGAGSHAVQLFEARTLSPGVYVLRLTQAARSVSARMVVMK